MKLIPQKFLIVLLIIIFNDANLGNCQSISPMGHKIKEHSFMVSFKYYKNVEFASYDDYENSPPRVKFYLLRKGNIIYELPDHFGNESWAFSEMIAVSFKDINYDGLKDIIVISSYETGIGPTGAEQFKVIDVYFQKVNGFEKNKKISEELNNELNFERLNTIQDIVLYFKIKYNK